MVSDDQKRLAVAEQLRTGARAYAAGATDEFLTSVPEIEEQHGARAYVMWQGFLAQRITEIATAVEFGEPTLFSGELNWLYSTLETRKISESHVRESLNCLSAALEEELPQSSWLFVKPTVDQASQFTPTSTSNGSVLMAVSSDDDDIGTLAHEFLQIALGGDRAKAMNLILDAFKEGIEPSSLYERVMLPVQAEIGSLWQLGKIGIADEHVATEIIRVAMTALWSESTGGVVNGPVVIVGSVTGDQHDTGVRAASQILDICGLTSIFLGSDLPYEEFAVAAHRFEAKAAVVSASMSIHLPRVAKTVKTLSDAVPGLAIVVGGPAFGHDDAVASKLAERMGAHGFARTPTAAAALISSIT